MAFRNLPEMPCGPILELHGQRKRFHVPFGLKRLLEDMTREVLRSQPDNIYEFLAQFMTARGDRRKSEMGKNKSRKSWQVHNWGFERSSVLNPEELKEFLESLGPPPAEAEHHAVVIQAAFRGYQARKKVKEIRRSIEEENHRKSMDMEAMAKARMSAGPRKSLVDTLTPDNATEAEQHSAVVIQSAFRGMQARKMVKERKSIIADDIRKSLLRFSVPAGDMPIGDEDRTNEGEQRKTVPQIQEPVAEDEVSPTPDTFTTTDAGPSSEYPEGEETSVTTTSAPAHPTMEESQDDVTAATEPTGENSPSPAQ